MDESQVSVSQLVPVFPLPEAVLFPRQILPLHIFEPRYRAMVTDALAGDELIAVTLLKRDYEPHYFTAHAPIHRLAGLGRIVASEKLAGGKFNILLRGESRAAVLEELSGRPYRRARVRIMQQYCSATYVAATQLREELCGSVRRHLGAEADLCEHFAQLFETPLTLGELADLIAGGLPIVGELRQRLLAELDACARAKMLLEQIHTLEAITRRARTVANQSESKLN